MVLKKFNITQSVFSIARKGNILSPPIFSGIVNIPSVIAREVRPKQSRKPAFSLIEMLMALLVASLLLAALAPVVTRRMNESLTVNSNVNFSDGETIVKELTFGMNEQTAVCTETGYEYDSKGNITGEYCEGTFVVPNDVYQLKVIAIGAGGGGGTAPTAGFTEYTTTGSTNSFTVPAMVNKLEATLISGGAGGGAGGQTLAEHTFVTSGNGGVTNQTDTKKLTVLSNATGTWTVPETARGKNILVTACGGGGGGAGSGTSGYIIDASKSGGGGSGGYVQNQVATLNNSSAANIFIGGGGGGGGGNDSYVTGGGARPYGGGAGGKEGGSAARVAGSYPGGDGGYTAVNTVTGALFSTGGSGDRGVGGNGSNAYTESITGGKGTIGGNGGNSGLWGTFANGLTYVTTLGGGSGAGGGSEGGGGGSSASTGAGGGGGGATLIKQGASELFNIGGGGGGGAGTVHIDTPDAGILFSGGGGGGGNGGGTGGGYSHSPYTGGYGGKGGVSGTIFNGGKVSTIWGGNYCGGGTASSANRGNGTSGYDGAITVKYLDYGPGGSGGGGGQFVPIQPITKITENQILTIKIGSGQTGGIKGRIDKKSDGFGEIVLPTLGKGEDPARSLYDDYVTEIYGNGETLLSTARIHNNDRYGYGLYGGSYTGEIFDKEHNPYYGCQGWSTDGVNYRYINYSSIGFSNTHGHNAGDAEGTQTIILQKHTFANGTTGGAGGTITTPWFKCTPGKGGTKDSPAGGDASGYGCGGGGGYGLSNGGKGSGGYARLSWNMFWDTATEAYKRAENGTGGGGASGNTIISGLDVIPGDVIRFRIGKGGAGAFVSNNTVTGAKSGGITVFGCSGNNNACTGGIRAGGGGGGGSTTINGANELINGIAGSISSECKVGGRNYINNTSVCSKGIAGKVSADKITGGEGAAYIIPASLSQYSKKLGAEALKGTGGKGGIQDTGENANGKPASGIASGGGGAAIRYSTTATLNSSETSNPISGGAGSDGKIILEWIKK